jgi:hypothetical protein
VKATDMARKLTRLEAKMPNLPMRGTTRIDWHCLTPAEKTLFTKIQAIRDQYTPEVPPDDVLQANAPLFDTGLQVLARRAMDVFVTVMPGILGDEIEAWFFQLHFYNFMEDLIDCLTNVRKWTDSDRREFLRDMQASGMIKKVFRIPRGHIHE